MSLKRPSLSCGECPHVGKIFNTIQKLNEHYRDLHGHLSTYKCGQGDCQARFLSKPSMIRHLKSLHVNLFQTEEIASTSSSSSIPVQAHQNMDVCPSNSFDSILVHEGSDLESMDNQHTENVEDDRDTGNVVESVDNSIDLSMVAAQIILELRSVASLTGRALQRFQDGCKKLLRSYRSKFVQQMSTLLERRGMSAIEIDALIAELDDVGDPFENLRTIQDQLDFFSTHFGLVKPVSKYLDTRLDSRLDPKTNVYIQTEVIESFQYVSLTESLAAILSNEKDRNIYFKDYASDDGVYRCFSDGFNYKNNPLLQKHRNILQLTLFYDELEVANPLGSKTIIHKLGVFFFQIMNAPSHMCSTLSSVHLLALVYADDMKKAGAFDKVLLPFVQEMKQLSSDEGVTIHLENSHFTLRAVLIGVTADTLAAHDLLGFLSPSAKHFCRVCMVSREEFHENVNMLGEIRSPEHHDIQVREVEERPRLSKNYGVKSNCALNKIPHFHCCGGSVFDAFHDLLEGICPLVLKCVLREFIINRKLITLENFNINLSSFNYGVPDSKNKPTPNFSKEILCERSRKLKQTGAQMWCLMRAVPFILGNVVPLNDPCMQLIFMLQDIMKIVFSFEIRPSDIDHLEGLIMRHNELFKELFVQSNTEVDRNDDDNEEGNADDSQLLTETGNGEEQEVVEQSQGEQSRKSKPFKPNMINKMHHWTHYGEMIKAFGPLVRLWCAKFEARMKIFRQHAAIVNCFKNIPKTMAEMFQLSNCSKTQNIIYEDMFSFEFKTGDNFRVDMDLHPELFIGLELIQPAYVTRKNSVIMNGEDYRPGLFVCISAPGTPNFSLISDIYIVDAKRIFFRVEPWKVVCLSDRYNAHQVVPDHDKACVFLHAKSLSYFNAIAPWTMDDGNIYLSLRTIVL